VKVATDFCRVFDLRSTESGFGSQGFAPTIGQNWKRRASVRHLRHRSGRKLLRTYDQPWTVGDLAGSELPRPQAAANEQVRTVGEHQRHNKLIVALVRCLSQRQREGSGERAQQQS
jgi:hypothetical protein